MAYVPERGDLIWIEFDPQAGHEQYGHRPAIVLSLKSYNQASGLMLCCPITSKVKGYPFELELPQGLTTKGAVLTDQVRNFDWAARNARFIEAAPNSFVERVLITTSRMLR